MQNIDACRKPCNCLDVFKFGNEVDRALRVSKLFWCQISLDVSTNCQAF